MMAMSRLASSGSDDTGLSYAGLLLLGVVLTVFAALISRVFTSIFISIVNTTAYLANETSLYRVGNYTVAVGVPSNPFARDVVSGLTWLLLGLLKLISDPLTFSLLVVLTLVIITIGVRLR